MSGGQVYQQAIPGVHRANQYVHPEVGDSGRKEARHSARARQPLHSTQNEDRVLYPRVNARKHAVEKHGGQEAEYEYGVPPMPRNSPRRGTGYTSFTSYPPPQDYIPSVNVEQLANSPASLVNAPASARPSTAPPPPTKELPIRTARPETRSTSSKVLRAPVPSFQVYRDAFEPLPQPLQAKPTLQVPAVFPLHINPPSQQPTYPPISSPAQQLPARQEPRRSSRSLEKWMQETEEQITCSICMQIMVGPLVLSPCGHELCGPCGVTWLGTRVGLLALISKAVYSRRDDQLTSGEEINCPQCRKQLTLAQPLIPSRGTEATVKRWIEWKSHHGGWEGLEEWKEKEELWKDNITHNPDLLAPPKPRVEFPPEALASNGGLLPEHGFAFNPQDLLHSLAVPLPVDDFFQDFPPARGGGEREGWRSQGLAAMFPGDFVFESLLSPARPMPVPLPTPSRPSTRERLHDMVAHGRPGDLLDLLARQLGAMDVAGRRRH